jgi:Mce-associated membrane protein
MNTDTDESPPELEDAAATKQSGEVSDESTDPTRAEAAGAGRFSWKRTLTYGVVPALALILVLGAGYLKWQAGSAALSETASVKSTQAAVEGTVAMLSYQPDTVEKDLSAAEDRLTGGFRVDYAKLINDVVIPGAKQKKISAVATVPAAASISATANRAVVLLFVNQTTTVGNDTPTASASSVRVTLDKVGERWLISHFDPV